jgi:lipoprotein-anchoring transpeptidase ErfK/SrfK
MTDAIKIARGGALVLVAAAALWSAPVRAEPVPYYAPTVSSQSDDAAEVPAHLRRQVIAYATHEAPGTIVIDTPNTSLYYVLGGGKAIRYGIGVGREGFTWSGVKSVERKAEWPDWVPPAEMLERQPYLPRFMAGGVTNPLGARAMYLGGTFYRIHGTNAPSTIGSRATAGCIRMVNEDVIDLYDRVKVGTKVVVLPAAERRAAAGFSLFH